jgi:hypothetical protein
MDEDNIKEPTIRVLYVPVGGAPYPMEIHNALEIYQGLVRGSIECFPLDSLYGSQFESGALAVMNEEGKITQGIYPNRKVFYQGKVFDIFYGDFIVCGQDGPEFASITPEIEDYYTKTFDLAMSGA